ncbi:MAG: FxsA family protein [Euzebyales bacterium]|jgi:UPF0716 protein FxsA|nr:FxsA family protein [Euzebyales bacterium]
MPLLLFCAFIVVPLVELWVILAVRDIIGLGQTIVLLLVVSVLGAALVRREGGRAWRRFREALSAGRMPAEEVVDGALLLGAGALLLTPGFVTDTVGLLLLLPPSRAVVNRLLRSRVRTSFGVAGGPGRSRGTVTPPATGDEPIDVEVISVERQERSGDGDPDPRDR